MTLWEKCLPSSSLVPGVLGAVAVVGKGQTDGYFQQQWPLKKFPFAFRQRSEKSVGGSPFPSISLVVLKFLLRLSLEGCCLLCNHRISPSEIVKISEIYPK